MQGHFSRFMRPGSRVLSVAPAAGELPYAGYEAVRAHAVACRSRRCAPATTLPLLAVGWLGGGATGAVLVNANDVARNYTLVDVAGGRQVRGVLPPQSLHTLSW